MSAMRVLAPKPKPSESPRGEGEHILHGATDLDAYDVRRRVGAEGGRGQILRKGGGEGSIRGGHGHGGGQTRADFRSEGRTGEHGESTPSAQHVAGDLVREHAGLGFKALGGPGESHL